MTDIPDNWRLRNPAPDREIKKESRVVNSSKFSNTFQNILFQRGLLSEDDIQNFLNPSIRSLHDPNLLIGMSSGVKRLIKAIESNEKITVFGDYDADGIISSALIYNFLNKLGLTVDIYIPDRFTEGYDLNLDYIKQVTREGNCDLIISVDCGTNNREVQQFLREEPDGPDVIVCDHHNASFEKYKKDDRYIIINPKLPDCRYPFKHLSGGGVCFKFIIGVLRQLDNEKKSLFRKDYLNSLLDLVAISTIADVMPLIGENRILVKRGLEKISTTKNEGLKTLIETSSGGVSSLGEYDIGFIIAPRINAAGRMKHAMKSFQLLSEEKKDFMKISTELENLNRDRQELQSKIIDEVLKTYDIEEIAHSRRVFIARSADWSEGVLGIVASEIVKRFNIPAILFREIEGKLKGSGRSTINFDLYENLLKFENMFERFGGHKQACGISMDNAVFEDFHDRFSKIVIEKISIEDLKNKYKYDMRLEFEDINMMLLEELELLKPHGEGNPRPSFITIDCNLLRWTPLKKGKHIKVLLEKDGIKLEGLLFKVEKWKKEIIEKKKTINILFNLQVNLWRGSKSIQLIIKDIY